MVHETDKPLEIDLEKIAQDIKNIRHFCDHLEALFNEAIAKNVLKDVEKKT